MKVCSRCNKDKSLSEFYADKRSPSGLKSQCKVCHVECSVRTRDPANTRRLRRESMRRRRAAEPDKYRQRERDASKRRVKTAQSQARSTLNNAVRSGKVDRPESCSQCGRSDLRIEGHHSDYAQPLVVQWLCSECHGSKHVGLGG